MEWQISSFNLSISCGQFYMKWEWNVLHWKHILHIAQQQYYQRSNVSLVTLPGCKLEGNPLAKHCNSHTNLALLVQVLFFFSHHADYHPDKHILYPHTFLIVYQLVPQHNSRNHLPLRKQTTARDFVTCYCWCGILCQTAYYIQHTWKLSWLHILPFLYSGIFHVTFVKRNSWFL